jgi:hypothetical protein
MKYVIIDSRLNYFKKKENLHCNYHKSPNMISKNGRDAFVRRSLFQNIKRSGDLISKNGRQVLNPKLENMNYEIVFISPQSEKPPICNLLFDCFGCCFYNWDSKNHGHNSSLSDGIHITAL